MPIYEYYCSKCQKEFELMRPISEASASAFCPSCGAEAEKLVSAAASKVATWLKPPERPFRQRPIKQG